MNRDSDLNESDFQVSERRVNSTCKGSETKWTKPHSKKTMCLRLRPLEGKCWKCLEGQGGGECSRRLCWSGPGGLSRPQGGEEVLRTHGWGRTGSQEA